MDQKGKNMKETGKKPGSAKTESTMTSGSIFSRHKTQKQMTLLPVDLNEVNLRRYMIHTPSYRMKRIFTDIKQQVFEVQLRMNEVDDECEQYISPSVSMKMLKNLYEETGEKELSLFLYYDELLLGRKQSLSKIHDSHMKKISEEIKRLYTVMRHNLLKTIQDYGATYELRLDMLTHVSNWLMGQQCILVDHLDSFSEEWEEFETNYDKTLYQQLQLFMDGFTKAVSSTRRLAEELFLKDDDEEPQVVEFDLKIPKTLIPSPGLMAKNISKFNWSVKKIKDFLELCALATDSTNFRKVFQNAQLLFSNLMEAVESNFQDVAEIDENLSDLHKKLAEVCRQLEGCNEDLNEAMAHHQELQEKYQELTATLNEVMEKRQKLQQGLENAEKVLKRLMGEIQQEDEENQMTEEEAEDDHEQWADGEQQDQSSSLPERTMSQTITEVHGEATKETVLQAIPDVQDEAPSSEPEQQVSGKVLDAEATQKLELSESTVLEGHVESDLQERQAESATQMKHPQSATQKRRVDSAKQKKPAVPPTLKGHAGSSTRMCVSSGKKRPQEYNYTQPSETMSKKIEWLLKEIGWCQDSICELSEQYKKLKAYVQQMENSIGSPENLMHQRDQDSLQEIMKALKFAKNIRKERRLQEFESAQGASSLASPDIKPSTTTQSIQSKTKQSDMGGDRNFSRVSGLLNSAGSSRKSAQLLVSSSSESDSQNLEMAGQTHSAMHLPMEADNRKGKTTDVKQLKKMEKGKASGQRIRSQRSSAMRVNLWLLRDGTLGSESSHYGACCVGSLHEVRLSHEPTEQQEEPSPQRPKNFSKNWSPPARSKEGSLSSIIPTSKPRKRSVSQKPAVMEQEKVTKEEIQAICRDILNQFLALGSKLSSILESHNFTEISDGIREAHAKLAAQFSDETSDAALNITPAVNQYFADISKLVQAAMKSISIKTTEERVKEMREETLRELSQKTVSMQNKITSLEEQHQMLWFMHLQLCEAVNAKQAEGKYQTVRPEGEMTAHFKQKPVTHVEWTLKLPADFISTNTRIIEQALFDNKISEKCFETVMACIKEVDGVVNAILPELACLYVIGHQIVHLEHLVQEQMDFYADNTELQDRWYTWEKRHKEHLSRKFQTISWNILLLKERRPRVTLDAWFTINLILIETGIKLIFPQPQLLTLDKERSSQYTKILRELTNVKGVPLITAENYKDVLTSGKLPGSFKKVLSRQLENNVNLSLDSRQSVTQATSGGLSKKTGRDQDNMNTRSTTRIKFKRSASINDVPEVPELSTDEI